MKLLKLDGWMDDLRFYILFNSISIISGQWVGDNERMYAIKPNLQLKSSPPQAGLDTRTARSVGPKTRNGLTQTSPLVQKKG